ncbi:MAG: hypothetical protein MJ201_05535 [Mycoplasmoidaceae bacterium]|nr:hypothetical protein [Mycoplasmoidaceae bacterium]
MNKYLKRNVDNILSKKIRIFGALHLVGPKWCGKSCSAARVCHSILKVDDFDENEIKFSINHNPKQYLQGKKPQLVDE